MFEIWNTFTLSSKIMLIFIVVFLAYVLTRLLSFAIFKSWVDSQKLLKKEDKNVIQKKSRKV